MSKSLFCPRIPVVAGLVFLVTSLYFIIHAAHFFGSTPEALGKYQSVKWLLWPHILFGAIALIAGPFLLWEPFRNRYLQAHRRLGMAYVVAVLTSGFCAIGLSATTAYEVNRPYAFSLHVWVGIWLFSTLFAFVAVKQRKVKLHREWMVRSYLLTFAFVLSALLLKLPGIQWFGSFEEISPSLFWLSWSVPLFAYDVKLSLGGQS